MLWNDWRQSSDHLKVGGSLVKLYKLAIEQKEIKDTLDTIDTIERQKSSFSLALHNDHMYVVSSILVVDSSALSQVRFGVTTLSET